MKKRTDGNEVEIKKYQITVDGIPLFIIDQPSLDDKINEMCKIFKSNKTGEKLFVFRLEEITTEELSILSEMLVGAGYIVTYVNALDCESEESEESKKFHHYLKVDLSKILKQIEEIHE